MIRLIGTVLLSIVLCSPALAATVHKCPAPKGMLSTNHTDERVRAAFARVIAQSQLKGSFALCVHPHYFPAAARIIFNDHRPSIIVVSVPRYVSHYSDDALDGMFGHEISHAAGLISPLISLANEKLADAQGRDWVGTAKMIAFLNATKQSLNRIPVRLRAAARNEIAVRMTALLDPILATDSRT